MAEFDPDKPARIYDNLNERFFDWDPRTPSTTGRRRDRPRTMAMRI